MKNVIAKYFGRFFLSAGIITLALKIFAEGSTTNPNDLLKNTFVHANLLGNGSILVGILIYFYGYIWASFNLDDSMEDNFKRLIYKIDRFTLKNLILAIVFVIIFYLSAYKIIVSLW